MSVIKRETDRKTEVSTALTEQYNRTLYSVFSGSTMHKHETKRGVLFSPFIQFSHKFNSIANTGDVFDDFCTTPTVAFWIPMPDNTVFSKPSSLNKWSSTFSLSVRQNQSTALQDGYGWLWDLSLWHSAVQTKLWEMALTIILLFTSGKVLLKLKAVYGPLQNQLL